MIGNRGAGLSSKDVIFTRMAQSAAAAAIEQTCLACRFAARRCADRARPPAAGLVTVVLTSVVLWCPVRCRGRPRRCASGPAADRRPGRAAGLADEPSWAGGRGAARGWRERDWPGDDVLIQLLTAAAAGTDIGRSQLQVELEMLGGVLNDQRGGYLDLTTGTVWPAELVDDGKVEGLGPFEEADSELWLDLPGEGNRDADRDMAGFTAELTDERVRGDLGAALEGNGALRRFQDALNRRETYRVHWRVFSTERRSGRARAWLADQGYDAVC